MQILLRHRVEFAQTQKVNVFWKFQSLAYLELFLFYQSGNFWRFCGDFRKKKTSKKIFFFKIFFSNFWKSLFLSVIWRDLRKIFFWKFQKNFFENFSLWKKCNFGHYFRFLIGFTHTNNLSMVLLSCLLKKFLCDMHTHWAPKHLKTAVCRSVDRYPVHTEKNVTPKDPLRINARDLKIPNTK